MGLSGAMSQGKLGPHLSLTQTHCVTGLLFLGAERPGQAEGVSLAFQGTISNPS